MSIWTSWSMFIYYLKFMSWLLLSFFFYNFGFKRGFSCVLLVIIDPYLRNPFFPLLLLLLLLLFSQLLSLSIIIVSFFHPSSVKILKIWVRRACYVILHNIKYCYNPFMTKVLKVKYVKPQNFKYGKTVEWVSKLDHSQMVLLESL